jgi:hypothetical protein
MEHEGPATPDPFAVLDVAEDADDETIRRRYLALVRLHPPERDPDRFGEIRTAFEAIRGRRDRMRVRLLTDHDAALQRLKRACLEAAGEPDRTPGRPGRPTVQALLREGADRIWAGRILPRADS